MTERDLVDIKVPVPPFKERKRIVHYLDKKCKEIDSLIQDIEKQIRALINLKNSTTSKSVLGLNESQNQVD